MLAEEEFHSAIDYRSFERLVSRFARLAEARIKNFMPDAPDRAYAEKSIIDCWEAEIFQGHETNQLVEAVEHGYRMGEPIVDLVNSVLATVRRLAEQGSKKKLSILSGGISEHRDAFKYIVHLFTFRWVIYQRTNPARVGEVSIIKTLPPVEKTLLADFLRQVPYDEDYSAISQQIEWLGTQTQLAALLVTLKKMGWISDYKPYSIVERAFANTKSIGQMLRPATEDGEAQYPRISSKDFGLFKDIRQNRKKKDSK